MNSCFNTNIYIAVFVFANIKFTIQILNCRNLFICVLKYIFKILNLKECEHQIRANLKTEKLPFLAKSGQRERRLRKTRVLKGYKSSRAQDFIGIWA